MTSVEQIRAEIVEQARGFEWSIDDDGDAVIRVDGSISLVIYGDELDGMYRDRHLFSRAPMVREFLAGLGDGDA